MATVAEKTKAVSTEEYLALPPSSDPTVKVDLVGGELVDVSRPTFEHNELLANLIALLMPLIQKGKLGRLSFDTIVLLHPSEDPLAPDLVFLSNERMQHLSGGRIHGVPDLVVEVTSPTTYSDDYGRKFMVYDRHAVPWLWIIDPADARIEEYRHTPGGFLRAQTILRDGIFTPGLFPGLQIRVAEIAPMITAPKSR